jgi:hypothetical protein
MSDGKLARSCWNWPVIGLIAAIGFSWSLVADAAAIQQLHRGQPAKPATVSVSDSGKFDLNCDIVIISEFSDGSTTKSPSTIHYSVDASSQTIKMIERDKITELPVSISPDKIVIGSLNKLDIKIHIDRINGSFVMDTLNLGAGSLREVGTCKPAAFNSPTPHAF